jgi:hypothetical protein
MRQPYRRGDAIVIRERWRDRVFEARPVVVVQDDPQQVALYLPGEVDCGVAVDDDGRLLRMPDRPWRLEVRRRGPQPILSFAWPDQPYAVLVWTAEDERRVWYVNLQEPLTRTSLGFDTVDHLLDVVIEIDRSSWRWKDEDELDQAIRDGLFSPADAARFRTSGERAVERVLGGEPPFDHDWSAWRPDPRWPTPELPTGWDRP